MSIKIWVAWKVPLSNFGEATDFLHQFMFSKAYEKYKALCECTIKDAVHMTEDERGKLWSAFVVNDLITKASMQPCWNSLDLRCGFHFWIDRGWVYLIPYGGHEPKEEDLPAYFKDFHYQNQTDPPENIPATQYANRCKTWARIHWNAPSSRSYRHEVVDPITSESIVALQMHYWKENGWGKESEE